MAWFFRPGYNDIVTRDDEAALARVLASQPEVDCAALFGSAASGRLTPDSDVDVYVRLGDGAQWEVARRVALADELSRRCGREVDLVVEDDGTSVILRREVAARGRPLYEARPGAWTDLRAAALVAYADLEPYMRLVGDAVRAAVRRG